MEIYIQKFWWRGGGGKKSRAASVVRDVRDTCAEQISLISVGALLPIATLGMLNKRVY